METAIKNRNESYYNQVDKFNLRRGTMFRLFKTYRALADYELSNKMKLPINSITGRRRELVQEFYLKPVGKKQNPYTDKSTTVWEIRDPRERTDLVIKEIESLKAERFTRLKDLEVIYISDLTKKDILHKVNKITELINKLEA